MPNIRVTCPSCKSVLEIDAAHDGQEVECGSCLQVFIAQAPKKTDDPGRSGRGGKIAGAGSSASSSRNKPARSSRRRDDDDDRERERERRRQEEEDDDYYNPPPPRSSGGNGLAVTSLVLGILSVGMVILTVVMGILLLPCVCCFPCLAWLPAPFTILCSLAATITGAIALKNPEGKPMAIIGIVLGILCLGFAGLQLAFGFLPFMGAAPPPPAIR